MYDRQCLSSDPVDRFGTHWLCGLPRNAIDGGGGGGGSGGAGGWGWGGVWGVGGFPHSPSAVTNLAQ